MRVLTLAQEDYETPLATGMRRLYTRLRPRLLRSNLRVLMLASALPGEGRSTVAANLAITIARHKRTPTLLVDADLRRPCLHMPMELARGRGVAELLRGEARIDDVVRETPYAGLRAVTAGAEAGDPAGLLVAPALARVVAELRSAYDLVLIDTPAVLSWPDAVHLAAAVDGVLMVVLARLTPRRAVLRAQASLLERGANVLGAVINDAATGGSADVDAAAMRSG